jgi:hypothetical protein
MDTLTIIISIITAIVTFAIIFYLKDFLQRRSNFIKLKNKLERIAGKGAPVIYSPGTGIGFGPQLFKIKNFDVDGILLENEMHTVFIPAAKLINTEMIVPTDDYDNMRKKKLKKDFDEIADAMIPVMFQKMIPAIKDIMANELLGDEGEIGIALGMKFEKLIKEEGLEIKKLNKKNPKEDEK